MNMVIRGEKGGGGKGGGGGGSRTPYEAPDNLLADSTAYVLDVVSEGEIEGWADPAYPGKCIYFDDTPLQNQDGSYNFTGVEYHLRTGTPDQEPVPGFSAVENEIGVSVEVKRSQPVARSITDPDIDAVRVKVGVAQLTTLDKESGDLTGATVQFSIDMQVGNGSWQTVKDLQFSGKTTSGYQRSYRLELPSTRPISIRVRRRTADQTSSEISDDIYFVSYTEIIDAKLRYPETAYVALAIPAQAFGGRVPRRSYRLKGMKCWVPSNYDPETRSYDESSIWNGTFKLAYTNNPAFFTYTVFIENRWGLGERIAPELVDKWRIYQIGKYCDELVPDGLGGQEPRFTMNGVMNTREAAYQVITQLSSTFRSVTYWGAGAVVVVQDAPSDPVKLVTNANVEGGAFNYAGTGLAARKTAAVVSFRDDADHFKLKAGIVFEDHDAIQRYGRRQVDVGQPFNSSRGQALRAAKWIVDTDTTQGETVNYQAGFDHASLRPGDRFLASDKNRVGFRLGGRLAAISGDRLTVTLDAPVSIVAGETYKILLANEVGDYSEFAIAPAQTGEQVDLPLASALPADFLPGTVFMLTASSLAPRLFRCLGNKPEGHLFSIVAIEDDPNKHARVEQGVRVDAGAPYILPSFAAPKPPVNIASRAFYRQTPAGLVVTVSWQVSPGDNAVAFQIDFTDHKGVRRTIGEQASQSVDIPLEGAHLGPFKVHIRSRNALNTWSPFAYHAFTVDADLLVPQNVSGFAIRVVGDQAYLNWGKADPVTSHYYVRYSADPEAGWNEALDVQTAVQGLELTAAALPGVYFVKAVSVFGFESAVASIVTSNTVNLAHHNVVETVKAEPAFAGSRDGGLSIQEQGLSLYSATSVFDWPDLFSMGDVYTHGGIPDEAFFELEKVVDLGAVYTSRVSADLRGYGFRTAFSVFNWADVFAVPDVYGNVGHLWRLSLQISTTGDDPDDAGASWTEWQEFVVGDYAARGLKFRVRFSSDDDLVAVVLKSLSVQIDMPDRIERGDDIDCPIGGVTIQFEPPFMAKPAIVVDGQGLPAGARSIRTAAGPGQFHQEFRDADGNQIAASFDYTAAGYGRDLSA